MKFTLCVLAVFAPAICQAEVAGDWVGLTTVDPQHSRHLVLHISGPDEALKATTDSPDQGRFNIPVPSIKFSNSTLEFNIPSADFSYSGVLDGNGKIAGTLVVRGVAKPLLFERAAAGTLTPANPTGTVVNGRYHDALTGVEFNLPAGWSLARTDPDPSNPTGARVFSDSSHQAMVITAFLAKADIDAQDIPKALDQAIPRLIAMRAGQTDNGPVHTAAIYRIREGSIDQTYINGHPTVRAIGEGTLRNGKTFAEYLAWIYTEHTRTYFTVRATADNLPALQAPFQAMIESAKIP